MFHIFLNLFFKLLKKEVRSQVYEQKKHSFRVR